MRVFARSNVLSAWPGASCVKGAAFPLGQARIRAALLSRRFVRGRTVVLLGFRTARAFGVRGGYFTRVRIRGADVVVVPHPSGVNRWFNDPDNVTKMRRFMRSLVRGRWRQS